MEKNNNYEVQYVQAVIRSSRNSGGGYRLPYQPSVENIRSFLMIIILTYFLRKTDDGTD